jgi:hypothetical protein
LQLLVPVHLSLPSTADSSSQMLPDPKLINSAVPYPLDMFDSNPPSHEEGINISLNEVMYFRKSSFITVQWSSCSTSHLNSL